MDNNLKGIKSRIEVQAIKSYMLFPCRVTQKKGQDEALNKAILTNLKNKLDAKKDLRAQELNNVIMGIYNNAMNDNKRISL